MKPGPTGERATRVVVVRDVVPVSVRVGVFGTFLILFLGALFYARGFVLPLVLACLLTLTLSPLVSRLKRLGIPAAISALLLVGAIGGGVATASMVLSGPFSEVVSTMPGTITTVRQRLALLKRPIATLNNVGQDIESTLSGTDESSGKTAVVVSGGGFLRWLVGTLADFGTTLAATLMLAVFLLAAMDSLRYKLVSVLPEMSGKKRSLRVLHDIEHDVSRYLVTVTAINAGLGILVGGTMTLAGLGNGLVWGVTAGLLNFIPYLGAMVGIAFVAAASLATFHDWAAAVTPPLIYLGLQMLEGGLVTPMILGRRLSMSPIAILTALSLTTWMWGIVGTLIGVPLLVVLKVFCDRFPSLAGLGVFLSGETNTAEEGGQG